MARYSGKGWHFQSQRHSNAAKTGHAGGKYTVFKKDRFGLNAEKVGEFNKTQAKVFPRDKFNVMEYKGLAKPLKNSKKDFGYAQSGFKTFPLKDGYEIEAHFEKTRNGFRHIALLKDKYGHIVDEAKATYLNRTWESYEYETVLNKLLDKSGVLTEPDKKSFLQKGELQAKKESEAMFGNVAKIASLGEIFGNTQKEKNDWKKRMLKAGLPSLDIPEDWEKLSEDEKENRLNKVIEQLKTKNTTTKHYGKASKGLYSFIKENRKEIDEAIRRVVPDDRIDDEERRQWILNDEGLYNWAKSEGVNI